MDDYWFNIKSIIITSLKILRSSHVICQSDNILFQEDYQGVIHKVHSIHSNVKWVKITKSLYSVFKNDKTQNNDLFISLKWKNAILEIALK